MKLRILTYNIHKGYDWKMRNYFLSDMRSLINSAHADIVFLQEVVGKNNIYKKKGLIDSQFEFLADTVWPHYSYAKNSLYDHGHHGNLILSRYPIESWENIDLTTNVLEKRGFLICKIQLPHLHKKNIYAACVHLDIFHSGRKQQYQMIKNKIQSLDFFDKTPLIIAGDFNDWNKKADIVFENELGMQEVHKEKHGYYAKTFPAGFPILSLDRIYIKNLKVINANIFFRLAHQNHFSDHLPIFSEVGNDEYIKAELL